MKQQEVFKKIGGILQELNDQYDYLKTVTDELNDLELELFVSNAHFLTDHVEILCKLNLKKEKLLAPPADLPTVIKENVQEPKYFEPVVQQVKHAPDASEQKPLIAAIPPAEPEPANDKETGERPVPEIDLTSGVPADTYSVMQEEPETIRHELILDESMNWDDDEILPEDELIAEDEITAEDEIALAADEPGLTAHAAGRTYNNPVETNDIKPAAHQHGNEKLHSETEKEVLTINEKILAQMGTKSMARTDQLGIKPITDIKLAISLNDKLLFVNELFNGYSLAYSEAIEILNRFNTFEEAERFLKTNYVTKNNWEGKPATTEKFYTLLKRRYA